MILGTGIDLLKISRVKKILDHYGDIFLNKDLTKQEIEKYKKTASKSNKLAKSFATKEAFVKALGTGFTSKVSFKDISLKNAKNGKPSIDLSKRVEEFLQKITPKGYKPVINVSISDEKDYVISNVIISLKENN